MANTTAYEPPDPTRALAGQVLQDTPDETYAAARFNNKLLAVYRCESVISQGWPDGLFAHTGAKTLGPTWDIEGISDRHTLLSVTINYTLVGAGSTVVFTLDSVSGADTQNSAALGPGGPVETTLPNLTIDPGATPEEVELRVETTAGGTVTVHDVRAEYVELASPLAAQAVSGASPIGNTRASADYPWTARSNLDHLTNLPIIRQRPRHLLTWSNLGSINSATLQQHIFHRSTVRVWPGSERQDIEVTARAYVSNATGSDQTLYWLVGDPSDLPNQRHPVAVANGFSGRKTTTFIIPEGAYLDGYPYAAAVIGLHLDSGSDPSFGESKVTVSRITVSGE